MVIYTIGHSTRSLDEFVALLDAHGVTRLADVRTIPRSRRHPHFASDALASALPRQKIAYRHCPGLGGLRKPRPDSTNSAWRHEGFRGYADYMQTPEFDRALDELIAWADEAGPKRPGLQAVRRADLPPSPEASAGRRSLGGGGSGPPRVAIMCAEAVWWRCHRQLIADALVARGIGVRHITSTSEPPAHTLTEFARLVGDRVSYPGVLD